MQLQFSKKIKSVLFPVMEKMGYKIELDETWDIQPALASYNRETKKITIDATAKDIEQVVAVLSFFYRLFPAGSKKAIYFEGGHRPGKEAHNLDHSAGYVEIYDYNLEEMGDFIKAIMIAAAIGCADQKKVGC